MKDLEHFYNGGFGWVCRACENDLAASIQEAARSRLLSEGEAESKDPRMSNTALAKWDDEDRTALVCPRCERTERIGTS